MKRYAVFAVALGTLLGAADSAPAKGVVAAEVCGADGCNEVRDRERLQPFGAAAGSTGPPRTASGWYRVTVAFGAEGEPGRQSFVVAVLPEEGMLRMEDGSWIPIEGDTLRAFRDAARGLEPLPVADLGLDPAPGAVAPADAGGDGRGVPPAIAAAGVAALLAGVALSPPLRRRLTGPRASS